MQTGPMRAEVDLRQFMLTNFVNLNLSSNSAQAQAHMIWAELFSGRASGLSNRAASIDNPSSCINDTKFQKVSLCSRIDWFHYSTW